MGGGIIATRNPNGIVLLFFILYRVSTINELCLRLKKIMQPQRLVFIISGGLIPVVLQCICWYLETGRLFIRSYNNSESFSWMSPHLMGVLFSVQKGMLVYAPVLVLAFIGMFILKKRDMSLFIPITTIVILDLWITSAWDQWQYGGSFGQRPFIDYYVFFAILMGFALQKMDNMFYYEKSEDCRKISHVSFFITMTPLFVFMIMVNLKFMIAYWNGILPYSNNTVNDIINVINWNMELEP